ncbi:MAG: hypothetical protein DHS20C04_26640 [Hyphococcus sp.]|nr:MAG: hypothetical protein DHS20C04_26640 [Marinicaulis sp.]
MIAAAPVFALYTMEALKIAAFEATRAPNVGLSAQLALMFLFFLAWAAAPRTVWALMRKAEDVPAFQSWPPRVLMVALAGAAMSVVHLFGLAVILRMLHSPPGWTAAHLAHSFAEVWIGYAGYWFLLYALACIIIFAAFWKPHRAATRIEVQKGGMNHSVGLNEIYWIEAGGNYVQLHTARGAYTVRKSLAAIAPEMGMDFIKSHRGALVNAAHVRAIEPLDGHNAYRVLLSSGASAPLSRRRLREFRKFVKEHPVS